MKRPAGIIILGILWFIIGVGKLSVPFYQPVLLGGTIQTGASAIVLRVVSSMLGIYVGYGVLKPFRHLWNLYLIQAVIGIATLSATMTRTSAIWEWHMLVNAKTQAIPRLVAFTQESALLLIAIYALTAVYVYQHKTYFWSNREL